MALSVLERLHNIVIPKKEEEEEKKKNVFYVLHNMTMTSSPAKKITRKWPKESETIMFGVSNSYLLSKHKNGLWSKQMFHIEKESYHHLFFFLLFLYIS